MSCVTSGWALPILSMTSSTPLRAHQVPEERESSVNHLIVVLDRYGPPQDVDYPPYPRWDVVFLGCAGAKGLVQGQHFVAECTDGLDDLVARFPFGHGFVSLFGFLEGFVSGECRVVRAVQVPEGPSDNKADRCGLTQNEDADRQRRLRRGCPCLWVLSYVPHYIGDEEHQSTQYGSSQPGPESAMA